MTNLNYLLLQLLQEKQTKEAVVNELTDHIKLNDIKLNTEKELTNWLSKQAKTTRPVLQHCCFIKDYQVFTDSAILYATTKKHEAIKEATDYPKCEKVIFVDNLTGGVKFDLRQLFNASQLFKNEAKKNIVVGFNDYIVSLGIEQLETLYKISGVKNATLKVIKDKPYSPLYLFTTTDILIITPYRHDEKTTTDIYVLDNGSMSIEKTDKLCSLLVEAKKEVVKPVEAKQPVAQVKATTTETKTEATKVIPQARGIKTASKSEKISVKQLSYLLLLTGKQYDENMSRYEASREITRIKQERLNKKVCEA